MDANATNPNSASQLRGGAPATTRTELGGSRRRRRVSGWRLLAALGAVLGLMALAFSATHRANDGPQAEIVRVARGDVVKTLTAEGSIESSQKIELKCNVPGGSTLLWVVEDGTEVKQGDELVRLDSSLLEEQVAEQQILMQQARAALISAERGLSAAEISVEEYRDGVYVQTRQELNLVEKTAEHALLQAQKTLQQSRLLVRRGFIDLVQLGSEQAAVEHAQLDLRVARRAVKVLDDYTMPKMLEELQCLRDAAQATLRAAQATFDLESDRLERLEAQRADCLIRAPRDGLAIRANNPRSSSETPQIDLGAPVRERQPIIWLPDLSQMQVRAVVHESQLPFMRPGLRARIDVQGRQFTGTVGEIAHQPERTRSSQRHKKYFATTVLIDDDSGDLRPGQTADVEILLVHHSDVLTVPVTAVVRQGDDVFAWVETPSAPERRQVVLGTVNDEIVEIASGLDEQDRVLSNPRIDAAALLPVFEPRLHMNPVERFGVADSVEEEHADSIAGRSHRQPASGAGGG